MAIVYSDDGIKGILQYILTAGTSGFPLGGSPNRIKLYQNNVTPTKSTVLGDFTEATFSGYAAITLNNMSWGTVSVTAHVASSLYGGSLTWTKSGATGNSIYGWYMDDGNLITPKLICSDRFSGAPLDMTVNGNSIVLALTISDLSTNG